MKLTDVRAIVTGAASGMGRGFACALLDEGASVCAVDVDADGLAELAVERAGDRLSTIRCDISREDEVISMVRRAAESMGAVNVLINNAGLFRDGLLVRRDRESGEVQRMSLEQWQKVIDVDLTGPFLCTREFAAHIVETDTRPAVVVNISSVSRHGNPGQSNYSAAKAGLVADTRLWASELARYGIRVGAIAPGFVDTPILRGMRDDVLAGMVARVPLGRVGSIEEMWLGVRFVLECDYFTGRCLDIDGGLSV